MVVNDGMTMTAVGREFGVTARTIRRWIDHANALAAKHRREAARLRRKGEARPPNTAEDRQRAVGLVVDKGRTKASVGREFGVTAGTITRWIDAIYPPPPPQEMITMEGWPLGINHAYGSPFPQRYHDLNTNQRRELRDQYVEHVGGQCLYCEEQLEDEPHKFVRQSADDIDWDNFPGGKEEFLKHLVHLHHDHNTGLTLAAVHALCNAHSWHFYESPTAMEKLIMPNKRMQSDVAFGRATDAGRHATGEIAMNFISIDVETANSNMASICQIGVAHFKDGELRDEWEVLVNPNDYFDGMNVAIHGISENDVANAPTYDSVYPELSRRLSNSIVVCHTYFDRVAIARACDQHSISPPSCQWLDSSRVARRAWSKFARKGYGLADLCKELGYDFSHHNALEDAKAAGYVLIAASRETGLDLAGWLDRVQKPI